MRRRRKVLTVAGFTALLVFISSALTHIVVLSQGGPVQYEDQVSENPLAGVLAHPTGLFLLPGATPPILYVSDTRNHVVREFQSGQVVLTAGTGAAGYADGALGTAQFDNPAGLWASSDSYYDVCGGILYPSDNILVSDGSNYVVRRICVGFYPGQACHPPIPCNNVTTVAGNHVQGFVDGPSTSAEFATLGCIAPSGSTFICDAQNHAIRSLSSGNVTTFAGTGTYGFQNGYRTSAQFNCPSKVAWDTSGNMYVADAGNNVIREIDTNGNVTTFSGSGSPGYADGPAGTAQFNMPTSVAFYNGYLYVADSMNNSIRRIDLSGNVTTYTGSTTGGFVNGSLSVALFACPMDLVIGNNVMYIADTNNNAVRLIDMVAGQVYTYAN